MAKKDKKKLLPRPICKPCKGSGYNLKTSGTCVYCSGTGYADNDIKL